MLICRDIIEIKSSRYLITLPGEWCHDDAETSPFNVNVRLLMFFAISHFRVAFPLCFKTSPDA